MKSDAMGRVVYSDRRSEEFAREWMTVKECSSKEDTDKWKDENGGSWIRDCRRSSSYNDSDELPSAKRGICWFHVCQNFDKELPKSKIYENACNEVKEDAKILARATCYEEFHAASLTLIAHWNQKWNEHRRIMGDLHKFHQSWLLKEDHHGWFYRFASSIGVGMSSLPTNNGLEGTKTCRIEQYIHGIHPPERKVW
uniref:Protein FAR1-RELATED SEQUENCE n=1 Tax=Ditylenchus dipsaci TaxID=166011 RepID=A0A915CNU6_9BILA